MRNAHQFADIIAQQGAVCLLIVYHFPQEAAQESSAFTVVGQTHGAGTPSGELMLVPRGALPAPEFSGCIFYLDPKAPERLPVCTSTLVCETFAASFPENPVYISSQLSGGTLRARLESALNTFSERLWLLIEPFSDFFPLPSPNGEGLCADPAEAHPLCGALPFRSDAFLCRCLPAEYKGQRGLLLFDTEETIHDKLKLAAELGIRNSLVLPEKSFFTPPVRNDISKRGI